MEYMICPICDELCKCDSVYITCEKCDIKLGKCSVTSKINKIQKWKQTNLNPYEIEALVNGHNGDRIKKIDVFKITILDMVERGITNSDMANILNCPVYTIQETLKKWGL